MPHINIKCYPKGLSEQQWQEFADDLTAFASERLNTPPEYISIACREVAEENWKDEVYDPEIKPQLGKLLREPGYEM